MISPSQPLAMTMTEDSNLLDFAAERARRQHGLNDKRLAEMRQAFEQAMPLTSKKKPKKKPKKR